MGADAPHAGKRISWCQMLQHCVLPCALHMSWTHTDASILRWGCGAAFLLFEQDNAMAVRLIALCWDLPCPGQAYVTLLKATHGASAPVCISACMHACMRPCNTCSDHGLHVGSHACTARMQVPASQADPCLSTDYVWTKGPGRMLGVLLAVEHEHSQPGSGDRKEPSSCSQPDAGISIVAAQSSSSSCFSSQLQGNGSGSLNSASATTTTVPCADAALGPSPCQTEARCSTDTSASATTGRVHVLKAFSGQMTGRWEIPGWVGPVAGITNTSELYQQYRCVSCTGSTEYKCASCAGSTYVCANCAGSTGARAALIPEAYSYRTLVLLCEHYEWFSMCSACNNLITADFLARSSRPCCIQTRKNPFLCRSG